MVSPIKYSAGIDVSEADFHVALKLLDNNLKTVIKGSRKFCNTPDGFKQFAVWLNQHKKVEVPIHITMEATGNYHENLAFYFHGKGYVVNVVLPNKSKKYLESLGNKSKTDKIDARGLAQMGAEQQLRQWHPFSESIYELRALTRYCEQLSAYRTMCSNQLKALSHGMYQVKTVNSGLQEMMESVDRQIAGVKQQIENLVKSDDRIWERMEKILPIKGLGIYSLATVIAETNCFELFENERQLCSFAGYDIIEKQSGTFKGKTRISKKGNSHIRRILHMPSLNVVRYKVKKFEQVYERIMSRHTKKKVAYVAIQRKLLALIYALWKKNEAYNPDYGQTSCKDESKPLPAVDATPVNDSLKTA
jgi:transposase